MNLRNFIGAGVIGIFWYFAAQIGTAQGDPAVPVTIYIVLALIGLMVGDIWEVRHGA